MFMKAGYKLFSQPDVQFMPNKFDDASTQHKPICVRIKYDPFIGFGYSFYQSLLSYSPELYRLF